MSNFVDQVKITAKAGNGGNGAVAFHREKYVANGGPDGGDGGHGGDVILLADENMHTLLDFRFHSKYTAENGGDGLGNLRSGKRGGDLIIKVPVGTVVRDAETGRIMADMNRAGETRVLLKGGRGGWGNRHFATSVRQAPNFAKPGTKTEIFTLRLELKTIADVGLVGYPNVGKKLHPVRGHQREAPGRKLPFHDPDAEPGHRPAVWAGHRAGGYPRTDRGRRRRSRTGA